MSNATKHDKPGIDGKLLRERRLTLGMTQERAAEFFSVNTATYSRWENEKFKPRPNQYPRIFQFLGGSPGFFYTS